MAKAESSIADKTAKKLPIKLVLAISMGLPVVGASCGYLAGYFPLFSATPESEKAAPAKEGHAAKSDGEKEPQLANEEGAHSTAEGEVATNDGKAPAGNAYPLDPIVTNITLPADVWVRFEAVIKASEPLEADIPQQIHQDILAFLRSLRLSELTGSSAFIDLKSELLARANTRSNGKVEAIYIKTFLFE